MFDRRIAYPRGRVIGGTSILNDMAHVRPAQPDPNLTPIMIAEKGADPIRQRARRSGRGKVF